MKIKNRLALLLLFICTSTLFAQPKISVKSFVKQENDLTARTYFPKKDQNGDVCAIIKVVTTQTGFAWDSDGLGIVAAEPKIGEYWIYVPHGAKRLTIQHPQLGILRDYLYPLPIEPATVYILELTTGKVEVTVTQETIGSEWVVITSEPSGADVYIDEKSTGKQTPFSMQYPLGVHTYSLSLDLYHSDGGRFELTPEGGKKKIPNTLKPAFGQLKLTSSPESGATVVLNGKPMEQTTPCTFDKIKSGTYPLIVSKTLYHDKNQTVTIMDGQTTNVDVVLKPSFGSIYITSSPETGAAVTLDDAPTGKLTPCTLDKIISGNHIVSLRKEWYQPVKKQLVVAEGEKTTLDVPMTALYGNVNVSTRPEADIYKDDEKLGTGTYTGRLTEGIYTFEARKPKHTSDIQKIQITSGEQKTITLSPRPQMGTVEIQSTPIEAIITLDGANKGTTPATLRNLIVGDYTLVLSLPGYATTTKTITITEGKTEQVNETLLNGRAVTIKSEPSGIPLFIDGKPVGQTPYSGSLTFGNHTLQIRHGEKKVEKSVNISQTGGETYFNLSVGRSVSINSDPSGVALFIDGNPAGQTPYNGSLTFGKHTLRIQQGENTAEKSVVISPTGGETSFSLSYGRSVSINSDPTGVTLSIDGNQVGQTPYHGNLAFGKHTLIIQQGEKRAEKTVSVSQSGGLTSFILNFGSISITETSNSLTIDMIAVKGGTFQMGSSDFGPIHSVMVSDFTIGKTEVTQAQWIAIMGSNPSNFKGDNIPVETVSWDDVQVFINKLNVRTGKTYRLPSEAEWEYAARGGDKSMGYSYSGSNLVGDVAEFEYNNNKSTKPIAGLKPNELGLYDMSGNVCEWCSDWYGVYDNSLQNNPKGPSMGQFRVLRGGSWYDRPSYCRVSYRRNCAPEERRFNNGFRLVHVP